MFENYKDCLFKDENKTVQEPGSHNLKWPYISDWPYRLLIIRGSGSEKAHALLNY